MELATGALGTLVPKLGQLLQDEYNLQKSVRKDVQFLVAELESMSVALRKVGEVPPEQLDEQVRIWARDVRELSYDMEDVVDTFLVRVDGPDQPRTETFKGLMKKMMKVLTTGTTRHQIAGEIKDIKERVKEVAERRDRYNVPSVNPTAAAIDPRITALYTKVTDLVGIDKARDDIISRLANGDDDVPTQQQKIVSIVGFGGLGKTTLAKVVYDNLKRQFDCAAFISVSRNPDMKKVFKDMLYELDKGMLINIHSAAWDERQLIDRIREFLQDKRYLIIVDDIWDIPSWKTIRHALLENSMGSIIITTTRNNDVAEQIGGLYKLMALAHENSKILFYGRIFDSEEKCPNQFSEVSEEILKKCGGVPLPIITTSSLLANKPRNIKAWHEVCNSIGSGLGNNPDLRDMRTILSLSYYDLPSQLCLLYLSIFPEDYVIDRDRLILRFTSTSIWMLVGFLFSYDKSSEGGDDGFNDGLDGGKFIVFVYGRLSVYPSFAKRIGFNLPCQR